LVQGWILAPKIPGLISACCLTRPVLSLLLSSPSLFTRCSSHTSLLDAPHHARLGPAPGPLHRLCPLPGMPAFRFSCSQILTLGLSPSVSSSGRAPPVTLISLTTLSPCCPEPFDSFLCVLANCLGSYSILGAWHILGAQKC
jgi:hypothetical protein